MKIAFFGLPLAALLLMEDGHELTLAVLSPVSHGGRRRLARRATGTRIIDALVDEVPDVSAELRDVDLLVSWFWTRRLPQRYLELPRLGAIGAHPSLLPRHRGPNPFFWTIDAGDSVTGVTVHRLTAAYDEGAIIGQRSVPVGERNAWQLARALDRPSLKLLRETAEAFERGSVDERAQDVALATWAPEPTGDLLRVNWSWPSERIVRRVRALSPVPGLPLELRGLKFFVTSASARPAPPALRPGEASLNLERGEVVLRTGDGGVSIDACSVVPDDESAEPETVDGSRLAQLVADRSEVLDSQASEAIE